jgi:heme A synthase
LRTNTSGQLRLWIFRAIFSIAFASFVIAVALYVRSFQIGDSLVWDHTFGSGRIAISLCSQRRHISVVLKLYDRPEDGFVFATADQSLQYDHWPDKHPWITPGNSVSVAGCGFHQTFTLNYFRYRETFLWFHPLWMALASIVVLAATWRKVSHTVRPGQCRRCGYDLRATPERCPECGTAGKSSGTQAGV